MSRMPLPPRCSRPMELNYGAAWALAGTPLPPWTLTFSTDDGVTVQVQSLITQPGQTGLIDTGVQVPVDTLPSRPPTPVGPVPPGAASLGPAASVAVPPAQPLARAGAGTVSVPGQPVAAPPPLQQQQQVVPGAVASTAAASSAASAGTATFASSGSLLAAATAGNVPVGP